MSDRSAELTCFYFGVGQGLFNAGVLKENVGSNQFAWVYDCGCSRKNEQPLIDRGANLRGQARISQKSPSSLPLQPFLGMYPLATSKGLFTPELHFGLRVIAQNKWRLRFGKRDRFH